MRRRFFYFLLVTIILGGLTGAISWWSFRGKPALLAKIILGAPTPTETVSTALAGQEMWQPQIDAIGTLAAPDGIGISTDAAGLVTQVFFDSGANVKKGDRLVQLDIDTDVANLKNIEAQLKNASGSFNRTHAVYKRGYAAAAAVDDARAQRDALEAQSELIKAQIAKKTILAPFSGRLGIRSISVGSYISPGQPIITLQQTNEIFADFPVTESQYGSLDIGQPVKATFDAWPGRIYQGEIATTDSQVSNSSRTLTVRARLENNDQKLLSGMYAKITVLTGDKKSVVTVPQTAIVYSLYGDSIYVAVTKTKNDKGEDLENPIQIAERRIIKLGGIRDGRAEILSGISPGEAVIVAGQNKIDQGTKLAINNSPPLSSLDVQTE